MVLAPGFPAVVPVAVAFPPRRPADDAPRLDPLSSQWLVRAALDGLAPATLVAYRSDIRTFLTWAAARHCTDWHQLDDDLLAGFLADEYARGVSRRLAARRAGVLASVLEYGRELGHPLARLTLRPRSHRPLAQIVQPAAVSAVLRRIRGDGYFSARDRAVIDLLYSAGTSASEACDLDIDHVDLAAGLVEIRGSRRRFRRVPIGRACIEHLRDWIALRRPLSTARSALFLGLDGGRLYTDALLRICHRRSVDAGQVPLLSPRILRNSCAVHMLEGGAERSSVAAILGLSLSQIDQLARSAKPGTTRR